MNRSVKNGFKAVGTAALITFAVGFAIFKFHGLGKDESERARVWFYDQNRKQLYSAPQSLIPPDGKGDDRVRAVVIAFTAGERDPAKLKIAYLEKYTPEFKAFLERAQATRAAKRLFQEKMPSRENARDSILVKRLDESTWHPTSTPEAQQLIAEWHSWRGPSGQRPIISVPRS